MFGADYGPGGSWTWDTLDVKFELFDRNGTRVLELPMEIVNSYGLVEYAQKAETILEAEFQLMGLRETLAITADYLGENIRRSLQPGFRK